MQPPTPPKISGVEVEPAEPTETDNASIARLSADSPAFAQFSVDSPAFAQFSADTNRSLSQVAQVVKVRLTSKPPITSMAWALYVNDVLIPKYWEYEDGIYFTVIDPQFFSDHKGKPLRFSQNGVDFFDTGMKLPAPTEPAAASKPRRKAAKSSKNKAAKSSKGKAAKSSKGKAAKSSKSKKR